MHIRETWITMVIESFANIAQNGTILCSKPGDGGTHCKMFDYAHITGGCGFTRGFAAGALKDGDVGIFACLNRADCICVHNG